MNVYGYTDFKMKKINFSKMSIIELNQINGGSANVNPGLPGTATNPGTVGGPVKPLPPLPPIPPMPCDNV